MRKLVFVVSLVAGMVAMASCKDNPVKEERKVLDERMRQEREFMDQAVRHRSPDVQRVDLIGNTVVYTHIFDGIIDVKSYTFDGDVCVEAERIYTFPNQMMALRHYRRGIEKAELYDNIELFNEQVKYNLKEQQYELETKGLTKEQLKEKFDNQIAKAKQDVKNYNDKMKEDGHKIKDDFRKDMKHHKK